MDKLEEDYKKVRGKIKEWILNSSMGAIPTKDGWDIVKTENGKVGIYVWSLPETKNFDWNETFKKLHRKEYEKIIHISVNSIGRPIISLPESDNKITFVVLNTDEEIDNFSIEPYLK